MLTGPALVAWLVALEGSAEPARRNALRGGHELAGIAAGDGLIRGDEQGHGHLMRYLARLHQDGWLAWRWERWNVDEEPANADAYRPEHLQRIADIRLTPEGLSAHAARLSLSTPEEPATPPAGHPANRFTDERRELFISHAGPDRETFVDALVDELKRRQRTIWYSEFEIRLGDALSERIDDGLKRSDFGVVILSEAFFARRWPKSELAAFLSLENFDGRKRILPVWHRVDQAFVAAQSPLLSIRVGVTTDAGVNAVADAIEDALTTHGDTATPVAADSRSTPAQADTDVALSTRERVVTLLDADRPVALAELLSEERRRFENGTLSVLAEAGDRLQNRADPELLQPIEEDLWRLIEVRLASLLPLVRYRPDLLEEEARALSAMCDRVPPTRSPYSAWQQGHRWAIWMTVWAAGAATITYAQHESAKVFWRVTVADGAERPPLAAMRQLGGFELGDRLTVARFKKRMPLEGLWHLAFRLSGSPLIERFYPELLRGPSEDRPLGFLSRAGDWAWTLAALSGRHGGEVAVPKYWYADQVDETLPRRLDQDAALRARFADELFGIPASTLETQAGEWVHRAPGPSNFL